MLTALQFVKGAVSRKDIVPALQHYRIHNGMVRSYNGTIGLNSPIACNLDITPNASQFLTAIEACDESVALSMWERKLVVHGGSFRTFVDCMAEDVFPDITPKGKLIKLDKGFLPALKFLEPFVATDASRPWACGVLLDGESAFATNNIVLQQYWLGYEFPIRVNIPHSAVRELIRIGEDPVAMQMDENNLTFHYEDKRWLTTRLLETEWPVNLQDLLDSVFQSSSPVFYDEDFFDALDKLVPFCDELGRVYLKDHTLSTSPKPDYSGATIELPYQLAQKGCFNIHQLIKLRGIATAIDFSSYPKPSSFTGDVTRGIISGLIQ